MPATFAFDICRLIVSSKVTVPRYITHQSDSFRIAEASVGEIKTRALFETLCSLLHIRFLVELRIISCIHRCVARLSTVGFAQVTATHVTI